MKKLLKLIESLFNYVLLPFVFFYMSIKLNFIVINPNAIYIKANFLYDILNFLSICLILRFIKNIKPIAINSYLLLHYHQEDIDFKQLNNENKDYGDSMPFIESNNPFLYSNKTVSLRE